MWLDKDDLRTFEAEDLLGGIEDDFETKAQEILNPPWKQIATDFETKAKALLGATQVGDTQTADWGRPNPMQTPVDQLNPRSILTEEAPAKPAWQQIFDDFQTKAGEILGGVGEYVGDRAGDIGKSYEEFANLEPREQQAAVLRNAPNAAGTAFTEIKREAGQIGNLAANFQETIAPGFLPRVHPADMTPEQYDQAFAALVNTRKNLMMRMGRSEAEATKAAEQEVEAQLGGARRDRGRFVGPATSAPEDTETALGALRAGKSPEDAQATALKSGEAYEAGNPIGALASSFAAPLGYPAELLRGAAVGVGAAAKAAGAAGMAFGGLKNVGKGAKAAGKLPPISNWPPSQWQASRQGMAHLYHETSPQTAVEIATGQGNLGGLAVSPIEDYALGQGGKGAMIRFGNTDAIEVIRLKRKPGLELAATSEGIWPEWEVIKAPSDGRSLVESITLAKGSDLPPRSVAARRIANSGWEREVLPDGRIRYSNPALEFEPSPSIPSTERNVGKGAKAAGKAEDVLRAAKGTPEQAAQLRPPEPGYAGNVNMGKFPEEVRPLIQRQMDENNQMAGMRQGVKSNATLEANAETLAAETSIEDLFGKAKPGKAYTDEEIKVIGDTLVKVSREYDELHATVNAAQQAAKVTPEMNAALAQKALEVGAMTALRSGAGTSAGRALHAFTLALNGEAATKEKAIAQAFKVLGGEDRFAAWLKKFNDIPKEDVVGRYKMVAGLASPTIWDKVNYLRYNSMLSSYKTHANNIISQAGTTANVPLELLASGHPKEAARYTKSLWQGIGDAWTSSVDLFKAGATPEQMAKLEVRHANPFGTGKAARVIGAPTDLLSAEDEFFKSINYGAALRLEAERAGKSAAEVQQLVANPTDAMVVRAQAAAEKSTYTEDPGWIVSHIMQAANAPGPSGVAMKFLLPFVRVPANIFRRGVGMAAQPVTGPVKTAYKLAKGDARGATTEAGKTAIASLATVAFAAMAMDGNLTGMGPSDPTKRKLLEEQGWQAHSLKIGDRWIDYTNFGAISVPLAVIASAWEGYKEGQKPNHELAADVTSRVARILLDTSYIKGIGQIFQSVNYGAGGVLNFASNTASTFIPYGSLGAAVERIVDPTARATDTPGASLMSRLPVASQMLPEQIGPYGKPRTSSENDLIGQILLPWRTSTERGDPVAKEVARLMSAGQSVPVRMYEEVYAGAKQSPQQQRALQETGGKLAATYISDYISRPDYQKLTDEQKAKTLGNVTRTAYELADLRMGEQIERDPRNKALLAWATLPHYEGVKGTPEQIRERNFEIAQAKAKLAEYRGKYGTDAGEYRLLKDDKQAWKLTQYRPLDSEYLAAKKKTIDRLFNGALTQAEKEGLLGSGNTVLPVGAGR